MDNIKGLQTRHHRALFQRSLPGQKVQCTLCPRSCVINDGDRGFCFGRRNIDGELVLDTFGRSSGFAVDPIEKKPLYHFYPATTVLSFGTIGCNLICRFCQNWRISCAEVADTPQVEAMPETIVKKARDFGIPSVAFTYNEPVVFAEYVIETAAVCRAAGIRTVAVTNGYITEAARRDFFQDIDAANVDLKSFNEGFYQRMCGGHLKPVLDTLKYLKRETDVWLEITTLVIPNENDDMDELKRMSAWIAKELGEDVPLHLTAFHPDFLLPDHPPTTLSTLETARGLALEEGLHYVYTGNVPDAFGSDTFCPSCGRLVIDREGFSVLRSAMKDGCCAACGAKIAGRF